MRTAKALWRPLVGSWLRRSGCFRRSSCPVACGTIFIDSAGVSACQMFFHRGPATVCLDPGHRAGPQWKTDMLHRIVRHMVVPNSLGGVSLRCHEVCVTVLKRTVASWSQMGSQVWQAMYQALETPSSETTAPVTAEATLTLGGKKETPSASNLRRLPTKSTCLV